jgi:AcrR family transcriptional regulator
MTKISINLKINSNLYLRDPQQTALGRKIIEHSILLIDEVGLECFNFKKLAGKIQSTEGSIYRYFENKHLLFLYLINWYWEWMKFRLDFHTMNIEDPSKRLKIALSVIVDTANRNTDVEFVDEMVLHRIVVAEGPKAYHNKTVDKENQEGFFLSYKSLCEKISEIIVDLVPDFPYPRALSSTLLEMANNQLYFAEHLPRLTDIRGDSESYSEKVVKLLEYFAFSLAQQTQSAQAKSNGNDPINMPAPSKENQRR